MTFCLMIGVEERRQWLFVLFLEQNLMTFCLFLEENLMT